MTSAAQWTIIPLSPGPLTIVLVCFFSFLGAQSADPINNRRIIHYGVEDGLSQGSVYSMLKDSRNFLWFTSYEGLNRFDGHDFKIYYPQLDDSTALRGNMTVGLVEDPYGNIRSARASAGLVRAPAAPTAGTPPSPTGKRKIRSRPHQRTGGLQKAIVYQHLS